MTLEERYTKAMKLAGYERAAVSADSMATVAFMNKNTGRIIQTDGWEGIGEELENLNPLLESETQDYLQLLHPEGRISFYCKNLGGSGVGGDMETVFYPDLESEVMAYLASGADGRILGYKVGADERSLAHFDAVDSQHHFVKDTPCNKIYDDLTVNEREYIREALHSIMPVLNKDNMYYAIHAGISAVAAKCFHDITSGQTEWGAWMGHIANTHRPQDYIEVDIVGYSEHHEVVCNLAVIHANEIVSKKMFVVNTDPEHLKDSLEKGIKESAKQLEPYIHGAVDLLDTDNEYPMALYSPYTFRDINDHYRMLENAGYPAAPFEKIPAAKDFKEMSKEEKNGYIQDVLFRYDEKLVCTGRVISSLAAAVIKTIDSGQICGTKSEIEKLLTEKPVIDFIRRHIPLTDEVPETVRNSVKRYFEENQGLKNFMPVEVCRISNHPEDDYLYAVIARQNDGKYGCWTSWNQKTESMNYGHYGLRSREDALYVIKENFNDIFDEIDNYGPEKSMSSVAEETVESVKEKPAAMPFAGRARGR